MKIQLNFRILEEEIASETFLTQNIKQKVLYCKFLGGFKKCVEKLNILSVDGSSFTSEELSYSVHIPDGTLLFLNNSCSN